MAQEGVSGLPVGGTGYFDVDVALGLLGGQYLGRRCLPAGPHGLSDERRELLVKVLNQRRVEDVLSRLASVVGVVIPLPAQVEVTVRVAEADLLDLMLLLILVICDPAVDLCVKRRVRVSVIFSSVRISSRLWMGYPDPDPTMR